MSFSKRSSGGVVDAACPLDSSHPLNAGLIGEWSIIPNSGWRGGLTLRDLVRGRRKPNDGTLTNGPTWAGAKGRPGGFGVLNLDGTNDYADAGSASALSNLDHAGMSACCWFYASSLSGNKQLIGRNDGNAVNAGWTLGYSASRSGLGFESERSSTNVKNRITYSTTGSWHHLAATYDGGSAGSGVILYFDGVAQAAGTTSTASGTQGSDSAQNVQIGGSTPSSSFWGYWNGMIDGVMIYNRVISAPEVAALYRESRAGNPERYRWIGRRTWYNIPVSSGLTADAIITLGALTIAAAATHPDTVDSSITLGAVTLSSAASHPDTADANITLGAVTVSSAATHPDTADANILLGDVTVASAVTHPNTADASITLGAMTITSAGSHPGLSTGTGINPLKVWGD